MGTGAGPPRRYLALVLPALATDRVVTARPAWRDTPVVTVAPGRRGVAVVAANRAARQGGIEVGATLAEARALHPALKVADADPGGDRAFLDRLAGWCLRWTPLTAADPPDGLILDITGAAHLVGGEAALLADACARLGRAGLAVRGAIADTAAAARALARFAGPATLCPPGRDAAAVAVLPVAALGIARDQAAALERRGLARISDLLAVPRAALGPRFGTELLDRLDRITGRAATPISPHTPAPRLSARHAAPEPVAAPEVIARIVDRLVRTLCRSLEAAAVGVRRLALAAYRCDLPPDHPPQTLVIGTGRPLDDPRRLMRLIADKLPAIDPGTGLDALIVWADAVEPLVATQLDLFAGTPPPAPASPRTADPAPTAASAGAGDTVADLIDRLSNRLGADRVVRAVPVESWQPERAQRWLAPGEPAPPEAAAAETAWPADRPRPPLLLARPEPIDVVAPVEDEPPLLFRWRGAVHRLSRVEGPERLAADWWRAPGPPRDYYRVEDTDGRRFWLFRTGEPPAWYLHGLFG